MSVNPANILAAIAGNIKSSPPAMPRSNTAETIRNILTELVQWVTENDFTPFHEWSGTQIRFFKADGVPGDWIDLKGAKGDKPGYEWNGSQIRFQNPDGSWGAYVDLKGLTGDKWINPKGDWLPNTPYLVGDGVYDGGNTYRCKTAHTSASSFNAVYWEVVALGGGTADGSVSREKLDLTLQSFLQYLTTNEIVMVDGANNKLFHLHTDGTIEGRFVLTEALLQNAQVGTAGLKPSSVTYSKLASEVVAMLLQSFDGTGRTDIGYFVDSANQIVARFQADGSLRARFDYSDSPIKLANLASDVTTGLFQPFNADNSKYLLAMYDGAKNLLVGLTQTGYLEGRFAIANGTISLSMLHAALQALIPTAAIKRATDPNPYEVAIDDDDQWRGVQITIPVKTEATGYGFARFASSVTPGLRGINSTGTALQFRQSYNLPIRGKNNRGSYNANNAGIQGTNYRGWYYDDGAWPITGMAAGDYYLAVFKTGTSRTVGGITYESNDLLIWNGSQIIVQKAPAVSPVAGDFWTVTAAGRYHDVTLAVGDRIICVGSQSASGPRIAQWIKQIPGELFLMGECNPVSFVPSAPINGDLYIYSASGTTQGIPGDVGDYLLYEDGWGKVPANLITVASGEYIVLPCSNAKEWEVRRLDKSTVQVDLTLKSYRTSLRRRANDDVVLFSDSLFGTGNLGNYIVAQLAPRTADFRSYGGGKSIDILSMVQKLIRSGDPFAGRLHVFWHGQNNQNDFVQIVQASMAMASLVGSQQRKFVFWSVMGFRGASWNGSRIVVSQFEDAIAGTNLIAQVEAWYQKAYPLNWFSPRQALLETAVGRTTPDLQYPGMTEAQVAATYNIPPFSYWFDYSTKPFTAEQVIFTGYWSTAGLPSGGSNFDYYVRTGGGSAGNIIVNVAGIWTEYTYDSIHLNNIGGAALAPKFVAFLNNRNL